MSVITSGWKDVDRQVLIDDIHQKFGEEVLKWPCTLRYFAKVDSYLEVLRVASDVLDREDTPMPLRNDMRGDLIRKYGELEKGWDTLLYSLQKGMKEGATRRQALEGRRGAYWEQANAADLGGAQRFRRNGEPTRTREPVPDIELVPTPDPKK